MVNWSNRATRGWSYGQVITDPRTPEERWLLDTLRRGLATVVSDDAHFSENIAARAADASLGGISRQLRLLDKLPATQPDWAANTLNTLSDIWTAIRAFRHRDRLPAALLHDLQTFLGIAAKKEATVFAMKSQEPAKWSENNRPSVVTIVVPGVQLEAGPIEIPL